jgi:hypothetical protein
MSSTRLSQALSSFHPYLLSDIISVDGITGFSFFITSSYFKHHKVSFMLMKRYDFRDERDVAAVESKFEELDYPMDVIWLDIEHTRGKRYFTVFH